MTRRLYYSDSYLAEFQATVLEARREAGRTLAVLDQTAFYPTSGGQPHDLGTLAERPVVDVVDGERGEVVHVVEGPLEAGREVTGRVDWRRRFDHMQQHTGQHVLSAAFERLFGIGTESFHLGAAASTIDLAATLTEAQLIAAEDASNRVVWEDRQVGVRFADAEEAARLPLRKEPKRSGELRLVEIDGCDLSACGGTHVRRTGAIGIICIRRAERYKGGTRVEFLCGGRALTGFRALRHAVDASLQILSVAPDELAAAIERQQLEARTARKTIAELLGRVAQYEASELAAGAEHLNGAEVVLRRVEQYEAQGLKSMAAAIAQRPQHVAVLVAGTPALVAVSSAEGSGVDAGAILRRLLDRFGGKGGGRSTLAQAGGLEASPEAILDEARAIIGALPRGAG